MAATAGKNGSIRTGYLTTSARGLRMDSVPMRLFQKAKKLGIWDPADLDFSQDKKDWDARSDIERDFLLRLLAQFQGGEEAVTVDLLPLIHAVAHDGHIEEEMFLTSFLWEEAKHVEMFRRFLNEVCEVDYDLHKYTDPSWRKIFYEELPTAMGRLLTDQSLEAQAIASTTYNMVIEGMLAETGYHGFRRGLKQNGLMPGICAGIELTARDESRHIRYGVFLLERLISEDPAMWDVINARMNELFPTALALVSEFWENYKEGEHPFDLTMDEFVDFSARKFDGRMKVLERDRGKAMAEIEKAVVMDIEADERELEEAFA
ncbi:MAG: R2-like ligand-binding oxidase [Candidatus Dormibacteraeota bacterium]|nr:R2-like ligand-binding oxidase [Candidatus Dormibacteraeota bacterium]